MTDNPTIARQAWVATAIDQLRENQSWTGRVHIHKLLYIAKELGLAAVPFEFELYHYGPYSFDLDAEIEEMQMYGQVAAEYPSPGYGPKYRLVSTGIELLKQLSGSNREQVGRVAKHLGPRNSRDLELLATCLWVKRREPSQCGSEAIVERVRQLKPRYTPDQVRAALVEAEQTASNLVLAG